MGWPWSKPTPCCTHDRLLVHSFKTYTYTSTLCAICEVCGTPVEHAMGFVAAKSHQKAAKAILTALGYRMDAEVAERWVRP